MKYPSRAIFAPGLRKLTGEIKAYLLSVLLLPLVASAGLYSRNTFPLDGISDSGLIINNGLALGFERYEMVKLFGDSSPSASSRTNHGDVIAWSRDTFSFFWADTLGKGIYTSDVVLSGSSSTISTSQKICNYSPYFYGYLHADGRDRKFLISFVEKASSSQLRLQLFNGNTSAVIDSSDSRLFLYSSQCQLAADTFYVINSVNLDKIVLRKVYSSGNTLQQKSTVVLATLPPLSGTGLYNCSIACDASGTVLVTWIRGAPGGTKDFHYQVVNRNMTLGPAGSIAGIRQGPDVVNFTDDAPIAVIAPNVFGVTTYDAFGIQLHRIGTDGSISSQRVISKSGIKNSAIATNGKQLYVLCKGDVNGDGIAAIEGYQYQISGNNITSPSYFSLSRPDIDVVNKDLYSTFLNLAVNDSGSIAAIWRNSEQVQGASWARRGIRNRKGFWISPVESLSVNPGDSIQFFRSQPTYSSLSSWYYLDSIRFGNASSDFSAAGGWVSLNDSIALAARRSTDSFFQYKVILGRQSAGTDTLNSVILSDIKIPFNVKPVITLLDSVRINGVRVTGKSFSQTADLLSYRDTSELFFTVRDIDAGEQMAARVSRGVAADTSFQMVSGPSFHGSVRVPPLLKSDTTFQIVFTVTDSRGWSASSKSFFLHTRNSVPILTFKAFTGNSPFDTVTLTDSAQFVFQEDDSLNVLWSVFDTNNTGSGKGWVNHKIGSQSSKLDSCFAGQSSSVKIKGSKLANVLWTELFVNGSDWDTIISKRVFIRANHIPQIRSATFDQTHFSEGDSLRVKIGQGAQLSVETEDIDLAIGDSLLYVLQTKSRVDTFKTAQEIFTCTFIPSIQDTFLKVFVSDSYGRSDTTGFIFKFPRYQPDLSASSPYRQALDTLSSGISLVKGSRDSSRIALPLVNSGCDTMSIVSIRFKNPSQSWLSLEIPQGAATALFHSQNYADFQPVKLSPFQSAYFDFILTADALVGDGFKYDTVIIGTSDPAYPYDTLLIKLEHNDLPQVINVHINFDPNVPYQPILQKRSANYSYTFPAHAGLRIDFSEPMDSASVRRGLFVYSVFDSLSSGRIDTIGLDYYWSNNYSTVEITSHYQSASSRYGLLPPPGLFIPTDSLALVLTSALTDRASTPSGPNALDVNRNSIRPSVLLDTSFQFKVDSIFFSLLSVSPPPLAQNMSTRPAILLVFSSDVFARSVDTNLINNKTLVVTSQMGGEKQFAFDSIRIKSDSIWFFPSLRFFYGDQVNCRYRGATVTNMLGFTADNSGDGISMPLMDMQSVEEDVEWSFTVKRNRLLSVSPVENSVLPDVGMSVVLTFEEPVITGTFDTDTSSSNRSFIVTSRYGANSSSPYSSISFSPDSLQVTLLPSWKFFSNDTITCHFNGFVNTYSYSSEKNLPDSAGQNEFSWTVYTGFTGFYTYPNPYRPSLDERHCGNGGPCGIVFKNLHVIKGSRQQVKIRIFNMKMVPVYSSEPFQFEPESTSYKPQWVWDTRNRSGKLVSSGVYFYAICDEKNRVLLKGKLMIVR